MATPNTEHVSPVVRRRVRQKLLTPQPKFIPGQRRPRAYVDNDSVHGGGGPENAGARSDKQAAISFYQAQPSWSADEAIRGEYFGPAAPSTKPDLSGMPSNNFRGLGDIHGGRQ